MESAVIIIFSSLILIHFPCYLVLSHALQDVRAPELVVREDQVPVMVQNTVLVKSMSWINSLAPIDCVGNLASLDDFIGQTEEKWIGQRTERW